MMFAGVAVTALCGILGLSSQTKIMGMVVMIGSGIGLYLIYVPFNNIIWDLMLATFHYRANSGFLMYLSDALGYLTSVAVLLGKNFGAGEMDWGKFYGGMCLVMAVLSVVCMGVSFAWYLVKYRTVEKDDERDGSQAKAAKEAYRALNGRGDDESTPNVPPLNDYTYSRLFPWHVC
jgi:uncharacterized membrane protein